MSDSRVNIVEVGPRDGLQNESTILSTADKLRFIELLFAAGLRTIEATSFVSPKKIPQMQDASELLTELATKNSAALNSLPCLVPNLEGLKKAIAAGVGHIALFSATSNTFNQKNINATIDQSFERLTPVAKKAKDQGIKIRAYVSTVFGCPYEGKTQLDVLVDVIKKFKDLGADEISLGDTTGIAYPRQVKEVLTVVKNEFSLDNFAMHFHDTYGMALANIAEAYEMGITTFDAAAGGLGGCPYAQGASGNVATEDVVYFFDKMGVPSGVHMLSLLEASHFILTKLNKKSPSKVHNVLCQKVKGVS